MDTSRNERQHRRRQRIACDSCRERKRKCDGKIPCDQCDRFEYDCFYRTTPRSRQAKSRKHSNTTVNATSPASGNLQEPSPRRTPHSRRSHDWGAEHIQDALLERTSHSRQSRNDRSVDGDDVLQAIEGNSGAAFARSLLRRLNPQEVPTMNMLAWNIFLGSRTVNTSPVGSLRKILSEHGLRQLVEVYLNKVQPTYSFIDGATLHAMVSSVWSLTPPTKAQNAIVCGFAALACLFAGDWDLEVEAKLVSLAESLLDPAHAEPPTLQTAVAWLLRTIYLRLTARPEEAWLTSCITMHVIDASGIAKRSRRNVDLTAQDRHWQQRVLDVAQHLNIWMSYDLGRSRVVLRDVDNFATESQPGEYTVEVLGLLPYSQDLDPANDMSPDKLAAALEAVLVRVHTTSPSVLAQCNLLLCIYRRLHAARIEVALDDLDRVVELLEKGLEAVHTVITDGLPWHHVANIPFQTVCSLLAIDTPEALGLLSGALGVVKRVNDVYRTTATQEAASTATSLLHLHRMRREADIRKQSSMLKYYPDLSQSTLNHNAFDLPDDLEMLDSWWHREFGLVNLDDVALI